MIPKNEPPRRWFGLLFIALAGGMVLWGFTVLKSRLEGKSFIVYWALCFLFTGLAVIFSFFESLRLRKYYQREQRELIAQAIQEIRKETGEKQ
ncbi:MAG: hypothetical protein WCO56_15390 [Verrucomicrobiota bacterium]